MNVGTNLYFKKKLLKVVTLGELTPEWWIG